MKHKLYYYEVILEIKIASKEESLQLKDKLLNSSFHLLGFETKVSKSKDFKGQKLKFQLFSCADVLNSKDVELLSLGNLHLINYRTRSITGEDIDILRNFYIMSDLMLKKLHFILGWDKTEATEELSEAKEA